VPSLCPEQPSKFCRQAANGRRRKKYVAPSDRLLERDVLGVCHVAALGLPSLEVCGKRRRIG
jgi:hypothetical protein